MFLIHFRSFSCFFILPFHLSPRLTLSGAELDRVNRSQMSFKTLVLILFLGYDFYYQLIRLSAIVFFNHVKSFKLANYFSRIKTRRIRTHDKRNKWLVSMICEYFLVHMLISNIYSRWVGIKNRMTMIPSSNRLTSTLRKFSV